MLLPTTSCVSLACECDASANYVDGLGGCGLLFAMEPQLKDQKNVMVELDVLPAPVMPTGDQLLFLLIVNLDASANYVDDGLGDVFLLFAMEPQLRIEECDGGAGCTSCACDANWSQSRRIECDASALSGLGGMYFLLFCLKDQCDGGAG